MVCALTMSEKYASFNANAHILPWVTTWIRSQHALSYSSMFGAVFLSAGASVKNRTVLIVSLNLM